jgi:hypothetical protein
MYVFLYGNVIKKELDFEKVLIQNFEGHKKLDEIIGLV